MTASNTPTTIKSIFSSGDSQLCVDSANSLWIMGANIGHRFSSEKGNTITNPLPIDIKLDAGEEVQTFYVYQQLVLVHTSHRRLFINRVTKQSANNIPGVLAERGEYFYEQASSTDQSVPNSQDTPAPDYWPTPQAIAFATAYTGPDPTSIDMNEYELVDTDSIPEVRPASSGVGSRIDFSHTYTLHSMPSPPRISDLDMIDEWDRDDEVPNHRPHGLRLGDMEADAVMSHAMSQSMVRTGSPSGLEPEYNWLETDSDTSMRRVPVQRSRPNSVDSNLTEELPARMYTYSNRVRMAYQSSLRTASLHSNNERSRVGDLELEYFGIDHGAALEADGHDFGLCNRLTGSLDHYYDNDSLRKDINRKLSVVLAETISFAPPLLEVDEIVCVDKTVFFRRGDLHYVYSWMLRPKTAMFAAAGLALTPTQHHQVLTYYQICWPFTPEVVQYRNNFVYGRTGSTHHVLTSSSEKPFKPIAWIYFPFCNLDPSEIHVSLVNNRLYVHQGNTVYEYLRLVQGLRPIIMDRPITMVYADSRKLVVPWCLGPDGCLTSRHFRLTVCQSDPWLEHIVTLCLNSRIKLSMIIVNVESPKQYRVCGNSLLINVRDNWHSKNPAVSGVMYKNAAGDYYIYTVKSYGKTSMFQLVETIQADDYTYYLYKWLNLPESLDCICVSNNCIIFRSPSKFYRSQVTKNIPQKLTELVLTQRVSITSVVDIKLADSVNRKLNGYSTVSVCVETVSNLFQRLCALAELFDSNTTLSISYTHKTRQVSHGNGVTRAFMQDALSQFALEYLVQKGACTVYNTDAWRTMTPSEIFYVGRALAMVIGHTSSYLPVRLPLAFTTALAKREPTIEELEYFLLKTNPEIYETITSYSNNPVALVDCGYDTYQEALNQCVHYDGDAYTQFVSRVLADGFRSHALTSNLPVMNLPTLDYYLSGPFVIDRRQLKQKISDRGSIGTFIKGLIDKLPERKLAILLRNWSGSSTVMDTNYGVSESNDGGFTFRTCMTQLTIDPRLLGSDSSISRAGLIDILTTPITFIND